MSDVRRAVVTALMKQEKDGYANLVLAHALEELGGAARDRAFFSAVFYGTVERMRTLDYIISQFVAKPIGKLDAPVRAILRSGLYQARWMDGVPVSAAVNEAVKLTRAMGKSSAAGMVNAVLRKAAAFKLEEAAFQTEEERLSVLYSVSPEIVALLQKELPQYSELLLRESFAHPQLCVRVNTLRTTCEEVETLFAAQGVATRRGNVPHCLYVAYQGDITAHEVFRKGWFHVQGEASQIACAALMVKPGDKVLDLCAAPGGKSATLAQYLQNSGVLHSRDAAQNRLSLIESVFLRLGVTCARVQQADAAQYDAALTSADAVLCDVPCSGLGILAKKPDIRQKNLEGLAELVALQQRILETAARYVRPGGRLVYSTCTVNPAENSRVVKAFLEKHPEFSPRLPAYLPHGALVEEAGVTLLPGLVQTDGFFIALLEKAQG